MTRHRLPWALALALAACSTLDVQETLPVQEQIPANAFAVYVLEPSLIAYLHTDSTTAGQGLKLRWVHVPGVSFAGYNCVALSRQSPSDTVGTFVFVARGANLGVLERTRPEGVDTIAGYFIAAGQGSRGSWALDSQNRLRLFWNNGTPSRYFDPAAAQRISADSLIADADLREVGDSIHTIWHVVWRQQGPC
jgi:hypothetical protein